MVFAEAWRSYTKNFSTAFSFSLLLVFVLPFVLLSTIFVSSGTVLIDYGFLSEPIIELVLLLVFSLLFLYFYSLLVCLIVLAVRKDLSQVRTAHYLNEKIHLFAFKYFRFLAIFAILGAIISSLLIDQGVPPVVINFALLLISSSFLFLAQTIVVDEESLTSSILTNWDFIGKNSGLFIKLMVFGIVSVAVLQFVEFAIDSVFLVGNFVSILIALVFLVPFFEALKTRLYMERFAIIKIYHAKD
ncbi:MAG TPA: hypothetical protein VFF13_05285 [archaeon]|nr:hypothetical protein [archaeon]